MTRTSKSFGARLQEARLALNVPADNLARAARLDADRLRRLEADEDEPTDAEVAVLADMLGRSERELVKGPLTPLAEDRVKSVRWRVQKRQGGRTRTLPPEERVHVAQNLRARREAAGLSQAEAAQIVGIAASNASMHENAEARISPGEETLRKYAALYQCSVADLRRPPGVLRASQPTPRYYGKVAGGDVPDSIKEQIAEFEKRINQQLAGREKAAAKLKPRAKK